MHPSHTPSWLHSTAACKASAPACKELGDHGGPGPLQRSSLPNLARAKPEGSGRHPRAGRAPPKEQNLPQNCRLLLKLPGTACSLPSLGKTVTGCTSEETGHLSPHSPPRAEPNRSMSSTSPRKGQREAVSPGSPELSCVRRSISSDCRTTLTSAAEQGTPPGLRQVKERRNDSPGFQESPRCISPALTRCASLTLTGHVLNRESRLSCA